MLAPLGSNNTSTNADSFQVVKVSRDSLCSGQEMGAWLSRSKSQTGKLSFNSRLEYSATVQYNNAQH